MTPEASQLLGRLEALTEHMATKAEVAQLETKLVEHTANLESKLTRAFIGLVASVIIAAASLGTLIVRLVS